MHAQTCMLACNRAWALQACAANLCSIGIQGNFQTSSGRHSPASAHRHYVSLLALEQEFDWVYSTGILHKLQLLPYPCGLVSCSDSRSVANPKTKVQPEVVSVVLGIDPSDNMPLAFYAVRVCLHTNSNAWTCCVQERCFWFPVVFDIPHVPMYHCKRSTGSCTPGACGSCSLRGPGQG